MLRRFLKNRRGTAEIIGSALFVVIILFFFSNVYLWHDQATREMNNVLLERMNASVSMVAADEGVNVTNINVTNNGGVTFALSRLWIIDDGGSESQHYYADLENDQISVVTGQTVQISLNSTAPTPVSPIPNTWDDTSKCVVVQFAPPAHDITLRILTELGNTGSCVVRRGSTAPSIIVSAAGGPVGTLVTLNGSNFEPASVITVKYDGITVPTSPPQPHTYDSGAFSNVALNIPISAFGPHNLTATDNGGGSASVTINVSTDSFLTLVPPSGSNGTFVTVSGNGFAANSTVTFTYINVQNLHINSITTTVTGSFTTSFTVPQNSPPSFTIIATDANNPSDSASGTFG